MLTWAKMYIEIRQKAASDQDLHRLLIKCSIKV